MATESAELAPHGWGDAPDLYGPRHDYRESLLLRRLRPLVRSGHLLNAGCGAGSLTLKLLDAGYEVTSVDASAAFVTRLASLLDARGLPGSRLAHVGDLHDLAFPDAAFDGAVCGEVLEHLDDDARAVAEIARVVKPGGPVVISVPANPWRYDWTDHWAGHRRRYTAAGLEARLADGGFADIEVIPYGFPLLGLYHRQVYRRFLRRRLEAEPGGDLGAPSGGGRHAARVLRTAFELDTLFLGRRPGYFGLIATARRRA